MRAFFEGISQARGAKWIFAAAALGLILLLLGGIQIRTGTPREDSGEEYYSVRFYTESLEERIAVLCRQVKGVSEAHVLLTLDAGSESVYAESTAGAARDYVILASSGEESAILVKEIYPRIRGVAVVCTRGDDSSVRLTVTELLSAALGIPSSSIRVAGT